MIRPLFIVIPSVACWDDHRIWDSKAHRFSRNWETCLCILLSKNPYTIWYVRLFKILRAWFFLSRSEMGLRQNIPYCFFLDAPSSTIIDADVMVKYSKTHADPQGWTFFLVHYHIPKIHIHISTMLCACWNYFRLHFFSTHLVKWRSSCRRSMCSAGFRPSRT